jgi:alpha-glucosidase
MQIDRWVRDVVDLDGCHLPFNFQLITTPWAASAVRQAVDAYEAALPAGGWPNWVLGNHDQHRLATRVGPAQARVANLLLLTLRGTPTCYYGDEIGMENVAIPPEMVQDPPAVRQPEIAAVVGRDPERTPMQWDASPNAGFAVPGVKTWLPVAADYETRNIAAQSADPASMLSFFRRLTELRQSEPALHLGDYESIETGSPDVFVYLREHGGDRFLVALNFGGQGQRFSLPLKVDSTKIVLSTRMDLSGPVELGALSLRPNEGVVIRLR